MALGDYTPTAWVNGTTPAINATNLGKIETKVNELDKGQAGIVNMFAGATVPDGWLLCNGQAVSRTTYASLFTAIGTAWGTGNGSTTFNVPDMREAAPVGVGTFSAVTGTTHGTQVAADAYTLGQFKDDQGQGHSHGEAARMSYGQYALPGAGATKYVFTDGTGTGFLAQTSDTVNGTVRIGPVTRGKRIGLNFIIKT